MTRILNLCVILLFVPMLGKQVLPEFFSVWYIQWTSYILLMVLLSFGLVKSIFGIPQLQGSALKKCSLSLLYLFLSLFSIGLLSVGSSMLSYTNSTVQKLSLPSNDRIEGALEALYLADNNTRTEIASYLYQTYGVPVLYKDESGENVIYQPNVDDEIKLQESQNSDIDVHRMMLQIEKNFVEASVLLNVSLLIYFLTFSISLIVEVKGVSVGKN